MFSCACDPPPNIHRQVRKTWSVHFQSCVCQFYDLNRYKYLGDSVLCEDFYEKNFPKEFNPNKPNEEYCDDLTGFDAGAWTKDITPWGHELYNWIKDKFRKGLFR